MRFIKRLLLRMELAHARYQVHHWSNEIAYASRHAGPKEIAFLLNCKADWILAVDDIRCDLAELDNDNDCEQLSARAIAPLHWRK